MQTRWPRCKHELCRFDSYAMLGGAGGLEDNQQRRSRRWSDDRSPRRSDSRGNVSRRGSTSNPLKDARNITPQRIGMGVDYDGTGPIDAIGHARITFAGTGMGGGWVCSTSLEHAGEREHVVDLVWVVRAPGGDDRDIVADLLRVDLGRRVGHREYDRAPGAIRRTAAADTAPGPETPTSTSASKHVVGRAPEPAPVRAPCERRPVAFKGRILTSPG
jgi:hypothetical protein